MLEQCCNSMAHYEHMCSLTMNGCAIESANYARQAECSPCNDKAHNHKFICTPNFIGT
jgi:hypothetical protein